MTMEKILTLFDCVYETIAPNLKTLCVFCLISHPLYWYCWQFMYPQRYESYAVRIVMMLICIPWFFHDKIAERNKHAFTLYYFVSAAAVGPFFFSYMMMMNSWSPVWVFSQITMIILLILALVDWTLIVASMVFGFVAALVVVSLKHGSLSFSGHNDSFIPIYIFLLIGALTIHREKVGDRKELWRRANIDYLTGAFNRFAFFSSAEKEVLRTGRFGGKLSLISFDLDFFKNVNDTYGHGAGDEVLKKTVEIVQSSVRNVDILGRLGGEEFAILLPETDKDGAFMVAERIRAQIEKCHIFLKDKNKDTIRITASFGVAESKGGESICDLLKFADEALYLAKNSGRNRVCCS